MYSRFSYAAVIAILTTSSNMTAAAAWPSDQNSPANFRTLGAMFKMADRNNDQQLSGDEYNSLRMNTLRNSQVSSYRSNARPAMIPTLQQSFGKLDLNHDNKLAMSEFMNASRIIMADTAVNNRDAAMSRRDASMSAPMAYAPPHVQAPDYVTATYYLTVNKVDTDQLKGKEVINLKGETVGKIDQIIRAKDGGTLYAMMDIRGTPRYRFAGKTDRDRAGIPLDDLLLSTVGEQLMLSTRGEEFLREGDAKLVENFEVVDNLYAF